MSEKIIFLPSIVNHTQYDGLYKDGFLVSQSKFNDKHLYIIGLDISYDTISYHEFVKFTLLSVTENQIISAYLNLFGESKLKRSINQKTSKHNLLFEIINNNKNNDVFYRYTNISKYFNKKEIKSFSDIDIKKLMIIDKTLTMDLSF